MKDARANGLAVWAKFVDPQIPQSAELESVSDDASFRRYFRFSAVADKRVFVDAPPEHEDNESFLKISGALVAAGVNAPEVFSADLGQGYMMIADLGDELYLERITQQPESTAGLYAEAVQALIRMQKIQCDLPVYDQVRLQSEMNLFHEWFLARQLKLELTGDVASLLQDVYRLLVDSALQQPSCFVHRDYHCRNLMVVTDNPPGIIDFQDAVTGPITYDLVSLYKDCYYRFDRQTVEGAVSDFHTNLVAAGVLTVDAPILRWFDLMGAQRHLKCAGIFSRLNLRDGKPGYLADIPLVIDYLVEVSSLYLELTGLGLWLKEEIQPRLTAPEFSR